MPIGWPTPRWMPPAEVKSENSKVKRTRTGRNQRFLVLFSFFLLTFSFDGAGHPTGWRAVSPIRAQRAGMARRAEFRHEDLVARHARGRETVADGRPAIEIPVPCAPSGGETGHGRIGWCRLRVRVKPSSEIGNGKSRRLEVPTNVGADFVAARPNRRPGGNDEIERTAAKFTAERLDGHARNTSSQTPPSGMRGRDRARTPIGHEQRHTVGRLNRKRRGRIVSNNDVRLLRIGRNPITLTAHGDVGPVHLLHADQSRAVDAHLARQVVPGFGSIPC